MQSQGTQAWDRYAYVSNNPVKYVDPSGHKACDETDANGTCFTEDDITEGKKETASKQGCSDPTYCENGQPKSHDKSGSIDIDEVLLLYPNFNPFFANTSITTWDEYWDSGLPSIDQGFLDLYESFGVDIEYYAVKGLHNPISVYDVPSELQVRFTPGPTGSAELSYFLREMGLTPTKDQMDYEPNYLYVMMRAYPSQLLSAIERYYAEYNPDTYRLPDLIPSGD